MKETLALSHENYLNLQRFTRCVKARMESRALLAMGAKSIDLFDEHGRVVLRQADQQVIGVLADMEVKYYKKLVHPIVEEDGEFVETTNEDMKQVLGEIIKIAEHERKLR